MRLCGPVFVNTDDPAEWVAAHCRLGYRAAGSPLKEPDADRAAAFVEAANKADLLIAEVGAWSNPISPDDSTRQKAIATCITRLETAEQLGARCCVNIAGSRGERWDGPHPDNLTDDTFDLIVHTVRHIIDAVNPTRTHYTLECMPWIFPDSPDSYLKLIAAVDREAFAVHLDPVNMVNCPARAYDTGRFIRECFTKLGPHIRSCHVKDITLHSKLTLHLDECRPGTGIMNYRVWLQEMNKLDPDTPLILEHLPSAEEYAEAAKHVRQVAKMENITL